MLASTLGTSLSMRAPPGSPVVKLALYAGEITVAGCGFPRVSGDAEVGSFFGE